MIVKRRKARAAMRDNNFLAAAAIFEDMAAMDATDLDAHIQVAQCYLQAEELEKAANWYLKTAKLYADSGSGVQSIALLQMYRKLRPEDTETCRTLFRQCRTQTEDPESLLAMLSKDDQACYSMRYGEIFSALDDDCFDDLLDDMNIHDLNDGDVLVRMGDTAKSLFLIAEGELQVWINKNKQRVRLGKIHTGGVCGEVPLFIEMKKRTADLIAHGATRVVEIRYALIQSIQKNNPAVGQRIEALYRNHVLQRQITLNGFFQALSPPIRQAAAKEMKPMGIRAGDVLFNTKDPSCDLYLLRSGVLVVDGLINGQKANGFKTVKVGDVVGELAVSNNSIRTKKVYAKTNAVLMRWSGDDYQRCYQTYELLQETVADRRKQYAEEMLQFFEHQP
ncbi:MAG: cyclic nucleotide-binding domain-containing protein [Mariprofundaceae bacterium]|nr:cyclic nucleotide-binding domain-containing protein [Mariprofundaceae bacterium]